MIFTARCNAERGIATASRLSVSLSVRPSVMLRYRDHIAWSSSKIISRLVWGFSLFVVCRPQLYGSTPRGTPRNFGCNKSWV